MNTRILVGIWTLVASLFVSMMVSAQTPAGLIDKWSADGNGVDSAGLADCLTAGLMFTQGQVGEAFNFDGTVFPDFGSNVCVFGTSDFTIDFWIQTSAGLETLFCRRATCEANNALECWMNSAGNIAFDLAGSAADACSAVSAKAVNDGAFHHVALVRRGQDLYVYIDGILDALASGNGTVNLQQISGGTDANPVPSVPDFVMGTGPCVGGGDRGSFVGALDEIEVYNRALSDSEVYGLVHADVGLAIVSQPFNQRTLVGRRVVFHVGVVGTSPISYQWRFNGLDLPGAIGANLEITNVQTTDAGSYAVVVNNPVGTVTSRTATLGVTNLYAPQDALVARWSGEGNAADSIGGNNGYLSNVSFAPGVVGTAFKFTGNGKFQCPNVLGEFGKGDFTLDYWMQTPLLPSGTFMGDLVESVVGEHYRWGDPSAFAHFTMHTPQDSTGQASAYLEFQFGREAMTSYFLDAIDPDDGCCRPNTTLSQVHLDDGVFHHIGVVRQSNRVTLYVDGRPVQSATTRNSLNYTGSMAPYSDGQLPFTMGNCGYQFGFVGKLDEIQVHSRAFTDAEIYSEYTPDPSLVIVNPPHDTALLEGKTTVLSVSAGGQGPYNYEWQVNGTTVFGATDSTFTINNARLSDAGTYHVTVANSTQSASADAHISVVASNSVLPGLVNKWTADGNTDDLLRNSIVRTFNPIYTPGVNGQGFRISDYSGYHFAEETASYDKDTGNFGSQDFTIDFWTKVEWWPWGGPILSKRPYVTIPPFYKIQPPASFYVLSVNPIMTNNTAALEFSGSDTQSNTFQTVTGYLPFGDYNFHHIALVRRGSTSLEIYFDGTLAAQTNVPYLGDLDNESLFRLHADYNEDYDEIELYNRALSPDEISGIYNNFANTPRISISSVHQYNVFTGDAITLTPPGQISGPGPFSYQWTLNGVAIAGATNSTLALNIDSSSGGLYALVVNNAYGSVTDPIASVELQLTPGSYNGLFYVEDDPTDDSSGYVTLEVNSSQTYSGKILQHGKTYPFSGRFSASRSTPTQIKRSGKSPLNLRLNIADASIAGVVNDGQRVVPLKAHRKVYTFSNPTPQSGQYTIAVSGVNSATAPNGNGFGTVTIAADGTVKLGMNLSDNVPASQTAGMASSGVWPLYISLYGGKGSVLGWLSFTNAPGSRCVGELRWIKAPNAGGKNYQGGFATKVPVTGSTFVPPATGLGINLMNCRVVLDGAKIYTPVSNQVTNLNGNLGTFVQANARPGKLTAKPSKGTFTGTFVHPVTKLNTTFQGIVLQEQGQAAGYFLSGNLSGRVVLQPK